MDKLSLVKSESFGAVVCDFYRNKDGEIAMTVAQLAEALGYAGKDAIEKIVARNPRLNDAKFSSTVRLSVVGKSREARVFTEDGIYEVAMLANTPNAEAFRDWIREVLKALRKGEALLVATKAVRRELTDVIRDSGENDRQHGHAHENFTNMVYRKLFGKSAKQMREENCWGPGEIVREHFTTEQRVQVARYEDAVRAWLAMGYSYEEIKGFLDVGPRAALMAH